MVHPNLDPTLGVAMGIEGVYPSMQEVKVGSGPRIDPDKPQKV